MRSSVQCYPSPVLWEEDEETAVPAADHVWAAEDALNTPLNWSDEGTVGGLVLSRNGTTPPPTIAGRWSSYAAIFDGVDQTIYHADTNDLTLLSDFTFNVWVKVQAALGNYLFAKAGAAPESREYFLFVTEAGGFVTARFDFIDQTTGLQYSVTSPEAFAIDDWAMITVQFDHAAEELRISVNGSAWTSDGTGTGPLSPTTGGQFEIGGLSVSPAYVAATVSELALFSSLLTTDEIASLLTASVLDTAAVAGLTTDEGTLTTDEGTLTTDES